MIRVSWLLPALAVLVSAAPAFAQDLSGTYELRALVGWRGARVELVLVRVGPDRYAARRTVRRDAAQVTHTGEALWTEDGLRLRLDAGPGLAGALSGASGERFSGVYRRNGQALSGQVRAPFTDGRVVTTREWGRRVGDVPVSSTSPGAVTDSATAGPRSPAALGGRLRVVGRQLRDPAGRAVLLRGVNVGLKHGSLLAPHTAADVQRLVERTGVDFVRYYVAWRAIEPEPLRYDEAYLQAAVEGIRRWTAAGVYVLVDMHQDVWGGPFTGHGAPGWASLGAQGGVQLPAGLPWQARYLEPRVHEQFEAFWANRPVPATGLGVQDHYARAWAQLASRLRGEDLVVGYDPMNEPFMGREIRRGALRLVLGSSGGLLSTGAGAALRSLLGGDSFGEELERRLLDLLREPRRFDAVLRRLEPAAARFEPRMVQFYARVGRALRAADPGRPLFVEPFALAGVGLPSHLPHPGLEQVVYAPHLYDSFMDSGYPFDGDARRVERAFERHLATAHRLGAPLVVGEWGNLPDREGAAEYAAAVGRLLDRHGVGSAYWDHTPGGGAWGEVGNGEAAAAHRRACSEDDPLFLAAMRPYAQRVQGDLVEAGYDAARRALTVDLRADPAVAAPTVLVAPPHAYAAGVQVRLDGAPAEWEHDPGRGLVYVWARGSGALTIELTPQE